MTDIIPTFNTKPVSIPAVGSNEVEGGWWVIGTLQPQTNSIYRLDVVAQLSFDTGLGMAIQIFDCKQVTLLDEPTIIVTKTVPTRIQSEETISLVKGRVYEIWARVISSTPMPNASEFGIVGVATFKW